MAGKRTSRTPTPMGRVGLIAGAVVLLIGAALWAGSVGPWIARPQGTPTNPQLPNFTPPDLTLPTVRAVDPPAAAPSGGSFDPTVVLLILGAVLLVALVLITASVIRNRVAPQPGRKPAQDRDVGLLPAPDAPDPARPFDPRQAADYVIACWDRLERLAAARGTGRRPEQTPTEFIEALKTFFPLDDGAAAELLVLYQRARFDHVALLPDTALRARSCADALLGALGGVPLGHP